MDVHTNCTVTTSNAAEVRLSHITVIYKIQCWTLIFSALVRSTGNSASSLFEINISLSLFLQTRVEIQKSWESLRGVDFPMLPRSTRSSLWTPNGDLFATSWISAWKIWTQFPRKLVRSRRQEIDPHGWRACVKVSACLLSKLHCFYFIILAGWRKCRWPAREVQGRKEENRRDRREGAGSNQEEGFSTCVNGKPRPWQCPHQPRWGQRNIALNLFNLFSSLQFNMLLKMDSGICT